MFRFNLKSIANVVLNASIGAVVVGGSMFLLGLGVETAILGAIGGALVFGVGCVIRMVYHNMLVKRAVAAMDNFSEKELNATA